MAAKRGFRVRFSTVNARSSGAPPRRGRVAIALAAASAITMLVIAAPALADTGSVYVDGHHNVGAGHDFFGGITPTSYRNVGLGYAVMPALTNGADNTAMGDSALSAVTTGTDNTATGSAALIHSNIGADNTANGALALQYATDGSENTAIGAAASQLLTTGDKNVAVGSAALEQATGDSNSNIALGYLAGFNLMSGSNNIDIGNRGGNAGESKTIRIGAKGDQTRAFVAGINGKTVSGTGTPVVVNDKGQLGTASAVSATKTAASKAATDRRFARMEAAMKRLQRQNRQQAKEIRALRAQK